MNAKVPNAIDIFVGTRIRLRRNLLNMSQITLGDQLGITFQQVQKYEKGTNRVGASRLQHIAHVLSVPVSYFFQQNESQFVDVNGIESGAVIDGLSSFIASTEGLALNRAFVQINDQKIRQKIVALVKVVAQSEADMSNATTQDTQPDHLDA